MIRKHRDKILDCQAKPHNLQLVVTSAEKEMEVCSIKLSVVEIKQSLEIMYGPSRYKTLVTYVN